MTQTMSKKIHQFVKDILNRTVNRAQSHKVGKNLTNQRVFSVKPSYSPVRS